MDRSRQRMAVLVYWQLPAQRRCEAGFLIRIAFLLRPFLVEPEISRALKTYLPLYGPALLALIETHNSDRRWGPKLAPGTSDGRIRQLAYRFYRPHSTMRQAMRRC